MRGEHGTAWMTRIFESMDGGGGGGGDIAQAGRDCWDKWKCSGRNTAAAANLRESLQDRRGHGRESIEASRVDGRKRE
jgi:hypothetical protein